MLVHDKKSPPGETAGFEAHTAESAVQANGAATSEVAAPEVSEQPVKALPLTGWRTGEKLKSLWRLLGRATRDSGLSRGDIVVLYSIADRVSDANVAWPGIDRLANDTGIHRTTVIRCVDRLEERGYLLRQSGGSGKANRYRLLGSADATGSANATGSADATKGVAPTQLEGVAPTQPESASLNLPIESAQEQVCTNGGKKTRPEEAATRGRTPAKSTLPDNFGISARIRAWAAEKGYDRLEERLEHFRLKAVANGYRYADWDAAFMQAIRGDWANLSHANNFLNSNNPRGSNNAAVHSRHVSAVERVRAHVVAAERRDADAVVGYFSAHAVAPHD